MGDGKRALAVECGEESVRHALAGWGSEVHGGRCDPDAPLPHEAAAFDRVFCVGAFERAVSPEILLAECLRVLRPGGRLVIGASNAAHIFQRLRMLAGRASFAEEGTHPSWESPRIRPFTPSSLVAFLEQGGLKILEASGAFASTRWPSLLSGRLWILAEPRPEALLKKEAATEPARADDYERYWDPGSGWTPRFGLSDSWRGFLEPFCARDASLLDLGCGDGGHYGEFVRERVREHHGIDVSETAAARARERGILAVQGDLAGPLSVEPDRFDRVLCLDVLEHLRRPGALLAEARRVLRPGGHLMLSVPNPCYFRERLLMLAGRLNPRGSPETSMAAPWRDPHIRFLTRRSVLRMLGAHGFQEAKVSGMAEGLILDAPVLGRLVPEGAGKRLSLILGFLPRLWSSLFAATLVATARKGFDKP